MEHNEEESELPILGLYLNDGDNSAFADLYYDIFPELYEVE